MAGPYNIDESLAPEDPDYYPWHEGVAAAVNDLHTRTAAVELGKAEAFGLIPAVGDYLGPAVANLFNSNSTGGLFASGDVYACPIFVHREITIDALGHFGGGEAVGVRLLVYASNADGYPDTLHATATYTSSGGNSSRVATLGAPVVFPPGLYWATIRTDGGASLAYRATNTGNIILGASVAGTDLAAPQRTMLPAIDPGTYASPASSISSWSWAQSPSNVVPIIWLRRSA